MRKVTGVVVLIVIQCLSAQAETQADICNSLEAEAEALKCSMSSLRAFSQQASEPAQTIAEASYDRCGWASAYLKRNIHFREAVPLSRYRQEKVRDFVVMVFESRLPTSEPRPITKAYDLMASLKFPQCPSR